MQLLSYTAERLHTCFVTMSYCPSKHQKAALGQIKHSILCSFICSDILYRVYKVYIGGGVAPSLPDHDDPNMPSRQVTGQA